jgi:2-amino-4-hydroxy-6-hydroxymethyldihydropteridine diphosphokinase
LNGVVLFACTAPLDEVLSRCQALEREAGRRRARHWGDRPLDLDLLVAEGITQDAPRLILPHPAIRARPFVWRPLLEVWPDVVDPRTGIRFAADLPVESPPTGAWARGVVANGAQPP